MWVGEEVDGVGLWEGMGVGVGDAGRFEGVRGGWECRVLRKNGV